MFLKIRSSAAAADAEAAAASSCATGSLSGVQSAATWDLSLSVAGLLADAAVNAPSRCLDGCLALSLVLPVLGRGIGLAEAEPTVTCAPAGVEFARRGVFGLQLRASAPCKALFVGGSQSGSFCGVFFRRATLTFGMRACRGRHCMKYVLNGNLHFQELGPSKYELGTYLRTKM